MIADNDLLPTIAIGNHVSYRSDYSSEISSHTKQTVGEDMWELVHDGSVRQDDIWRKT